MPTPGAFWSISKTELLLFSIFYFLSFWGVIHLISHFCRASPSANEAGVLGEDLNRRSPHANIATQRVITQKGIILDSVRVWL
jgi:hypothetical protein